MQQTARPRIHFLFQKLDNYDHVITRSRRVEVTIKNEVEKHGKSLSSNTTHASGIYKRQTPVDCALITMPTSTFYDILAVDQSASADDGLFFFYTAADKL